MNDFFIFVSAFVSIVVLVTLAYLNRMIEALSARIDASARLQENAAKTLDRLGETPHILKQLAGVLSAQNFQLESLDRRMGGGDAVKVEKTPRS